MDARVLDEAKETRERPSMFEFFLQRLEFANPRVGWQWEAFDEFCSGRLWDLGITLVAEDAAHNWYYDSSQYVEYTDRRRPGTLRVLIDETVDRIYENNRRAGDPDRVDNILERAFPGENTYEHIARVLRPRLVRAYVDCAHFYQFDVNRRLWTCNNHETQEAFAKAAAEAADDFEHYLRLHTDGWWVSHNDVEYAKKVQRWWCEERRTPAGPRWRTLFEQEGSLTDTSRLLREIAEQTTKLEKELDEDEDEDRKQLRLFRDGVTPDDARMILAHYMMSWDPRYTSTKDFLEAETPHMVCRYVWHWYYVLRSWGVRKPYPPNDPLYTRKADAKRYIEEENAKNADDPDAPYLSLVGSDMD